METIILSYSPRMRIVENQMEKNMENEMDTGIILGYIGLFSNIPI